MSTIALRLLELRHLKGISICVITYSDDNINGQPWTSTYGLVPCIRMVDPFCHWTVFDCGYQINASRGGKISTLCIFFIFDSYIPHLGWMDTHLHWPKMMGLNVNRHLVRNVLWLWSCCSNIPWLGFLGRRMNSLNFGAASSRKASGHDWFIGLWR